jgi:3-hydroxyacyl-CoA dehydrogenase
MGASIAAACLLAGLHVTIIERDEQRAGIARGRVPRHPRRQRETRASDPEARANAESALTVATNFGPLAHADLIIEAVFEDMDVKKAVFAELDAVARPDAVLASNTSYLDIDEIAAGTSDPGRVIGLHFFSPAHVMKLLELIVTRRAAPDVLATGLALGKRLRKITVPAGVCDGFIGNRIMARYRREADYMLEDGALPHEVDAAMRDFGFPMGVFQMADLAGLDIGWAMRKRQAATRDPSERYVEIADRICEIGRLGRKTGRGWYDYSEDPRRARPLGDRADRGGIRPQGHHAAKLRRGRDHGRILSVMQDEGEAILGRRHRRLARGHRRRDDQRLRLPALARRPDVHEGAGRVTGEPTPSTGRTPSTIPPTCRAAMRWTGSGPKWPPRGATFSGPKAETDIPYGDGPRNASTCSPRRLAAGPRRLRPWRLLAVDGQIRLSPISPRARAAAAGPWRCRATRKRPEAACRDRGGGRGGHRQRRRADRRPGPPRRAFGGRAPRRAHGLRSRPSARRCRDAGSNACSRSAASMTCAHCSCRR